jgi:FkbM family methyltransferase
MREGIDAVLEIGDRNQRLQALLALIEPEDVVIDCGANVGSIAAKFAARGCYLRCFEPDPQAFAILEAKLGKNAKCELHRAAVWKEAGRANLFFHRERETAEITLTQSSSLMADKINVDSALAQEVELIDFPSFLRSLRAPAAVLKMDIEGAEGELLKAILEQRLESRFQLCLVETHERKVPSSRPAMDFVRQTIAERGIRHIFLDWK